MALRNILQEITKTLQHFEHIVALTMGKPPPSAAAFAFAGVDYQPNCHENSPAKPFSLKDIVGDGFLWAVPKHRRTLEKRLTRKYGDREHYWKMLEPRKTLKVCNTCGDDHEAGVLCPTCYKKIIEETKEMQDAIQQELKLEPVENEIVVMYEGEKTEKPDEFFEGKRIVEMKKSRPSWFSKNLLQQTTQKPATTSDVKPSELG